MNIKQRRLIERIKKYDFIGEPGNYEEHVQPEDVISVYKGEAAKKAEKIEVSIIIPTMNRPLLLKEALESVISQNIGIEYEIVVLNNEGQNKENSPTDEIVLSLNSDRIMYFRNRECVISPDNWNTLLFLARGKWVCMLHDDDVLAPNALKSLLDAVNSNEQVSFLGCTNVSFREGDTISPASKVQRVKRIRATEFMYGMPVSLLGAFFDRKKAIEMGGFENRSFMQDYSFISKYAFIHGVYLLKADLYYYRISDLQDSANNEMNFVRRVADYYLWRSIAERRGILHKVFEKNCQYNIMNRINAYNSDTKYAGNHIDPNEIMDVCEIEKNKLFGFEYMMLKGLHGAVIIKDTLLTLIGK